MTDTKQDYEITMHGDLSLTYKTFIHRKGAPEDGLDISLWLNDHAYRISIASFEYGAGAWNLWSVDDRIIDERVNWDDLKLLVLEGKERLKGVTPREIYARFDIDKDGDHPLIDENGKIIGRAVGDAHEGNFEICLFDDVLGPDTDWRHMKRIVEAKFAFLEDHPIG